MTCLCVLDPSDPNGSICVPQPDECVDVKEFGPEPVCTPHAGKETHHWVRFPSGCDGSNYRVPHIWINISKEVDGQNEKDTMKLD
jgi:hypothetical protein